MRELSDDEVFGSTKELSDADVFGTSTKPLTASNYLSAVDARRNKDAGGASWTDNLRDITASILKIGPTAVKGFADIGRLATADSIGVDTSNAMKRGMESIDQVIGSDALQAQRANINQALQNPDVSIGQLPGVVLQNPRAALDTAVSAVGSMALPTGAAVGATKMLPTLAKFFPTLATVAPGAAATGASVITGAGQNAADTFAGTEGQSIEDRYTGAGISGAASLILGKLLGGGAEGVVARRMAGETGARGAMEIAKSAAKTGGKEFIQEGGEESSNYVGQQVAKHEAIDPQAMAKQGMYGGMVGLGVGGATDVATNLGNVGAGSMERQIANEINKAAQDLADRQTPQVVQQTVARIFDKMPKLTPVADNIQLDKEPVTNGAADVLQPVDSSTAGSVAPDADTSVAAPQRVFDAGQLDLTGNGTTEPEVRTSPLATDGQRAQQDAPANTQPAADVAEQVSQPATLVATEAGAGGTQPTQAAPTPTATPAPAPTPKASTGYIGQDGTSIDEGGTPFKSKMAAQKAKKLQPMMRVKKVEGGFVLADKTPAQLAAEAKAAKRISGANAEAGSKGRPMAAHEFIASRGGMAPSERSDLGIEGNIKVGNRWLFAGKGKGMTIAQATEALQEAGYIKEDSHNAAYDLIKRSVSNPQYTDEGWEGVAELERQTQFEDYLASQQEAAQEDDFDPFAPLDDFGLSQEDDAGFVQASPELQAEVAAYAAQLDALGIDAESILERIAVQYPQVTQDQYYEHTKDAFTQAIAEATKPTSSGNTGQDGGEQGNPRGQVEAPTEEALSTYTPQDIEDRLAKLEQAEQERKQQDREAEQKAKAERDAKDIESRQRASSDNFQLGQSAEDSLSGQTDIFSAPPQEEAKQATEPAKAKEPNTDDKKITDFGEKIGGARKDVWTSFKDQLNDVEDGDIAAQPLSKVWPQPDYQALIDSGTDPWAVGFVRAARDEIPAKPRAPYKVKRWAEQVKTLRSFANLFMGEDESNKGAAKAFVEKSQTIKPFLGRVELYMEVGHSKSLEGITMEKNFYSLYRGEQNVSKWVISKGTTTIGNWPREIAAADTKEEAIAKFKEIYSAMGGKEDAKKQVSFDIYSKFKVNGYFVGKKVGRNYIDLAGPFATVKEARAYKNDSQDELVAKLEKAKEIPMERRNINDPRVGEDMRSGQDVTPQAFGEAFGFRGVEFGNWVEQGRRQQDLNDAYDALMDMAALLDIPPKAISLNGQLGLAFGARGSGGVNPAKAHYERDMVVINLTKKNGAGSLGHEWWHALDNYFSRERKSADGMMTDSTDVKLASRGSKYFHQDKGVRQEMIDAFGRVMKSINATAIKARSSVLDGKRSKEYWTTDVEMSARAFESYLISKLQDQNASNDYLANIVDEKTWDAMAALGMELDKSYPYPTAGEVPEIRAGFDAFFNAIEHRETDKGIALYEPESQYNIEAPKTKYTDDKQLQLFLDNGPDQSQAGTRGEVAQRAAVAAVDDLRRTETLLGLALSSDYAARQRATLVGQKVGSAEDLATLAQVYRDPRFETFRVVFVNDGGKVVSQVGLTSRLPASTAVIMGKDVDSYLASIAATARNRGASGYYLLHNHPSGEPAPSRADIRLTQSFADTIKDLEFKSHVVIDTNKYSTIGKTGMIDFFYKNFGQPEPYRAQEWADVKINNPADVMSMVKRIEVDKDAVTLIHTDAQFNVKALSTIPTEATIGEGASKQIVKASLKVQGSQIFAVSRNSAALLRINSMVRDAIHIDENGKVSSFAEKGLADGGQPFPASRRTRLSPDTSPEFGYLRSFGEDANLMVAEQGKEYGNDQQTELDINEPGFATNSTRPSATTWTVPEPGAGDAFIRAIQNNKIDLKRVRDAISDQYGNLKQYADAYLNEELYHGKVAARVAELHKEHIEPILAKIAIAGKNVGVTLDDVNLYLHARHAPERNAAMKSINPNMKGNEALSGLSDQEATKVLADFNAAGKGNALTLIAKDIDQLLSDTRTGLVADGLEDAGVVGAWEAAYKHYVPLQRDIGSSGTPKGMGFSVRGPEAKRAVGSNKEVVNILANIVTQAETAAIRAEKAIVGRSLLAMARQYPNEDFWTVDKAPTKPRINKDTGLVERNAIDPLYQTADNVMMVKDYGQEHFIVFNKKNERAVAVAKAMKNLDIEPMNKILEIANKGTRFLASMLTQRNPFFWLTNFARDVQGAMLNLEGTDAEGLQQKVMDNLPKAFKGMHAVVRGEGVGQWARYAKEMQQAGGTTGYMQAFDNSDVRMKDLKKEVARMQQGKADPRRLARMALEFVDDYNDIIENAVRLSVFQAAREGGVPTQKAASIAKNITVNFNRKGNMTPSVNALYMFFNASLQGTARLAQAVTTSKTARIAVGGIAVMGFMMDMLNRMVAGDDDETKRNRYDLIPEFEKSHNWIFMNPIRPGEYVKVPLPLGPHVFHNAGRLLSDAINRKDSRNASEYGWSMASIFLDAFSPMGQAASVSQLIAPSVLDPVVQAAENKSFTGAPVYKSAERFGKTDPRPAYTRYFENTPDVWKGASRMLNDISGGDKVKPGMVNIEPDIMKHVFYTLTGGPGRTLDQTIDMAQAGARGKELTVSRVPLANRFYGANDDQQRERAYYDDRKRAADAKTQFDYYIKQGRQDLAKEVASELGDGDVTKGRRMMLEFSRSDKSVRKINGEIRRQMEREDNGDAKSEQLKALHQRRVRVMSDALDDE